MLEEVCNKSANFCQMLISMKFQLTDFQFCRSKKKLQKMFANLLKSVPITENEQNFRKNKIC